MADDAADAPPPSAPPPKTAGSQAAEKSAYLSVRKSSEKSPKGTKDSPGKNSSSKSAHISTMRSLGLLHELQVGAH